MSDLGLSGVPWEAGTEQPNRVPPRECIRVARDALNMMYSHTDAPVEKLWMFMAGALDWQRRAIEQMVADA